MRVREATAEDFPALVEFGRNFHQATAYTHIPYSEESAHRWLTLMRDKGVLLIAENGGPVGGAGGLIAPCLINDSITIGTEMFWWVEPEHRGSSAGARLLYGLERAAKARGVHSWAMVALEDEAAEKIGRMYRKSGYMLTEYTFIKVLN